MATFLIWGVLKARTMLRKKLSKMAPKMTLVGCIIFSLRDASSEMSPKNARPLK